VTCPGFRYASVLLLGLLAVGGVLAAQHAGATTRIDLNDGWRFRIDPQDQGQRDGWYRNPPAQSEAVTVPHTWGLGKYASYEGTAWYFKTFTLPHALHGQHVEIHFGATFYKAQVWLNGTLIGAHEGGYSHYYFDISSQLRAENTLAVAIDNTPRIDTIPGKPLSIGPAERIYDWWPYGGIVRGVWLAVSEQAIVRSQHIDSVVQAQGADIHDRIMVENFSSQPMNLTLNATVLAEDGTDTMATQQTSLVAPPGRQSVDVALALKSVRRWDIDNPYLYTLRVSLSAADGGELDRIEDEFGVRSIEIRDRHLLLNGRRVRLSGLTRHEESPWEGLAETAGTMRHDLDDMKNLQTTLTRPVHYQQHPFIYRYADHQGILMIPEIPMWQFSEEQMKNPKVIALAKQMLQELIEENYNHPSIFAWSVDNESATNTPGGIAYFRTMYALAKQLDPARAVSCADDRIAFTADPKTNASSLADFVMWNEYFGTWDAPESLLPTAFDRIDKGYPTKMVIVSEFGVPGLFATNATTADELRVATIRNHLALYAQHDWIGGAILWSYEDYRSHRNLRAQQDDEYVDHGLVDKDRQRKPSYYVWQRENEPARVEASWSYDVKGVPDGFTVTIARRTETELPSYELLNYQLTWRVVDGAGKEISAGQQMFADIGAPQRLSARWNSPDTKNYHLELNLVRPTGFTAVKRSMNWKPPQTGGYSGEPAH
jgi:beta-glucuronidase